MSNSFHSSVTEDPARLSIGPIDREIVFQTRHLGCVTSLASHGICQKRGGIECPLGAQEVFLPRSKEDCSSKGISVDT